MIPGADREHEVVLSCHLDHQRPGANDNASGCATILEVGRTLAKLMREGKLPTPRRTIRFVWPPEIEGTTSLLNARPDLAARALAVIHMDMVGGDAEITKAVFHVTRSPKSLPTFVDDVGAAFGRFVNEQSYSLAATGEAPYPLVDPEGSKRALQAEFVDFTEGSDHQVWSEGSWRVPAIYLNDWPDRYIHTHADGVANIDPTKLMRAAFLGAASAWYLAGLDPPQVPALWEVIRRGGLERTADALARADRLRAMGEGAEADNLLRFHLAHEAALVESIGRFAAVPPGVRKSADEHLSNLRRLIGITEARAAGAAGLVYRRAPAPKGAMGGFGYDYFQDHIDAEGDRGARPAEADRPLGRRRRLRLRGAEPRRRPADGRGDPGRARRHLRPGAACLRSRNISGISKRSEFCNGRRHRMLRENLIGRHVHKPHEFRWRSREISRLEGLSDAVFGFAITLLIVALEVPKTSGELFETMRGFAGFAITFFILYTLWYRQFVYFRRYGLEDPPTVALTGALLFVVLFFVFPLKFFVGTMVNRLLGASKTIRLPDGTLERVIRPEHIPIMLSIYAGGFVAVSAIFFLLYSHAYRKREELDLNELEIFDTRRTLEALRHTITMGLLLLMIAWVGNLAHGKPYEDSATYASVGALYVYVAFMVYRTRLLGRRRKEMVARIKALGEGDPGPLLQS